MLQTLMLLTFSPAAALLDVPPAGIWSPPPLPVLPNTLHVGGVVGAVNPTFASWNVDGSYNRGFFHVRWGNANLRAAAASLQPSTLRFGGGGNDFIRYDAPPGTCSAKGNQDRGPPLPPGYNCLNASHFADFFGMANRSGAQLIFGLSFDKVTACVEHQKYVWNSSNAVAWIKHMQAAGQDVWGYELGNEVNNQGVRPDGSPDRHNCSILPQSQADAIESLAQELEKLYPDAATRPRLIGPDTGYANPQFWLNQTLRAVGHRLHAVTHHVYLGVSKTSFNSGRKLDSALANDIAWYLPIVRTHASAAQVRAGCRMPEAGGLPTPHLPQPHIIVCLMCVCAAMGTAPRLYAPPLPPPPPCAGVGG
jgi:hypothetical protein